MDENYNKLLDCIKWILYLRKLHAYFDCFFAVDDMETIELIEDNENRLAAWRALAKLIYRMYKGQDCEKEREKVYQFVSIISPILYK